MQVRSGACPALSGREKVRQDHVDGTVGEVAVGSGLEVTAKEQQAQVNHEKGQAEMERCDTCAKNL